MSAFSFLRPELLALGIPLGALLWMTRREQNPLTIGLRIVAAIALILAIAGLHTKRERSGHTVIFAVDRSASMPITADAEAIELIDLALDARGTDDAVRVVTFGEDATLESTVSDETRGFSGFVHDVDEDGSDLEAALESALAMVPEGRSASIAVLSDGEVDGARSVEAIALRAAARGVRIDTRGLGRTRIEDTAVERLELPPEVDVGEPFFVTAWIRTDRSETRTLRLLQSGEEVSRQVVNLPAGRTRVRFPTRMRRAGIAPYRVEVLPMPGQGSAAGGAAPSAAPKRDRIAENDRALGATRAIGPKPLLLINHDGKTDSLAAALKAAGLPVTTVTPDAAPASVVALDAFRGVIIENVSAGRLGLKGMDTLRTWVLDHGGGVMMTGGQASFASGGYYRSPLDGILPVTMELRQEHRKLAIAMSIVLDRSGSMSAPVDAGRTKMDLANAGTVEALGLLTSNDSVSVIAVDSSPHVIQEQTNLDNREDVISRVRSIRSQGGGIFTAVGLRAAALELSNADQVGRHVILFADAADAEEQAETPAAVKLLRDLGATISVIALGTESDSDAQFLKDTAIAGGGESYFTTSPEELPRLFAMETQAVARSTFVEEPTGVTLRPELFGLGEIRADGFPNLDGYNLTYLAEGASLGAVTTDEYKAPIFAFQARGLGRAAALPAQLGGGKNAALDAWDGYGSFLVTIARWLSGVEAPEGVFASVEREGRDAVFTVEFDPNYDMTRLGDKLVAVLQPEGGKRTEVALERIDATRFGGRAALPSEKVVMATLVIDGTGTEGPQAVPLPPLAVPYSPEFERPTDPTSGERLLRRLSQRTGGVTSLSVADLFRQNARASAGWDLLTRPLLLLALLAMVLEVAARRLQIWWHRASRLADQESDMESEAAPTPTAPVEHEDESLESALDKARRTAAARRA